MELLRERDWHAAFELLGRVAEAGSDPLAFARTAVEGLPALVASDLTTLSECDLVSGHRRVLSSPGNAIGAAERASFDRHFREHPLVRYHADLRGPGAHRVTDSMPFTAFRHTALYCDYYRRIGIDHVVALPIHVDERWLVSLVLNRRARDFSDRDLTLLDRVGPPLAALYDQARARQALQRRWREVHALLMDDADETAAATPAHDGAALTAREREVMRWLAAGKADRDIGELLGCSHRTVHKHLQRIYVKLGVETRTAAVMRWLAALPPG